jgi:hypothetical protein
MAQGNGNSRLPSVGDGVEAHLTCLRLDDGRVQYHEQDEIEGGWRAEAVFVSDPDTRYVTLIRLTIDHVGADSPPGPITTATLRKVRLRGMQERAEQFIRTLAPPEDEPLADALGAPRPGPDPTWTDTRVATVASRYVAVTVGERAPLRALANELHVSYATARSVIELARARGLLTKTIRGRAGGSLTKKAVELLKDT